MSQLEFLATDQEKVKALRGKGDKLVVLRNALFDDDEGGFGAERDVTRWLAAPFRTYTRHGLDMSIEFAHGESLMGAELGDLLSLAEAFAAEVEEDAGREYHAEDKEEHLTEDAARFLVARDQHGKVAAFAHFRFTLHGELADVMEGEPCLFIYDVHVASGYQRKGLGKHLVSMLELIARKAKMTEMVLPVPNSPLAEGVRAFVASGLKGWAADGLDSVAPKTARALADDGSLLVYVKLLQPRPAAQTEADKAAAAAAAAARRAAETKAVEGEWTTSTNETPAAAGQGVVAAQGAAAGAGKKNKKGKGKGKKSAAAASDKAAAESPSANTEGSCEGSCEGSSVQAPLAVE